MRMTWDVRNIDEETLDETILESSGDSVRSNMYLSYSSTSQIVTSTGSLNNVSRVCSHCGTSKTPLWRSGPRGPKSLCNACGIRLKKVGRCIVKKGFRTKSMPSLGKSCKSSSRTFKLGHVQASKKTKPSRKTDAEESSEMGNVSDNTMQPNVIPHYARRHVAARRDLPHLNHVLAKLYEKIKLARGICLSNDVARDEEDGALSLMALSYGY